MIENTKCDKNVSKSTDKNIVKYAHDTEGSTLPGKPSSVTLAWTNGDSASTLAYLSNYFTYTDIGHSIQANVEIVCRVSRVENSFKKIMSATSDVKNVNTESVKVVKEVCDS